MSDTRLTLIGIALIFAGFLVLGVFGQKYYEFSIQEKEFGNCFEFKDGKKTEIDCSIVMQNKTIFFALVVGLIGMGIFFLINGVRGKWDQDVKAEDKVGPDTPI
jgi:hypothetical protein